MPIIPIKGLMMHRDHANRPSVDLRLRHSGRSHSLARWLRLRCAWLRCAWLCGTWLCFTWLGGLQVAGPAFGQRFDSFEGGTPRWALVESDCQAQLVEHEISMIQPRAGRTSELFQVACGTGQNVLLAYPIEPCIALSEFEPQLWTRCSSGGVRLGVRVRFPFAEHPVTHGRLQSLLWGDTYSQAGEWQMLKVTEIEKHLQNAMVGLRQEFGGSLNLEGATIDCLVLNAYTGPGRYRVQVDDLDLRGMVPLAALGRPLEPNWRERWRWRESPPDPEARFWATANRPPVWLQYHDEPLPWVRSLGFNGLFLERLPEERQLVRIQHAGLTVVAPPPAYDLELSAPARQAVKGWFIGAALDARQIEVAKSETQRALELSEELRRPVVGEALEQFWMFSRVADEVMVPVPGPTLAGSAREKHQWLAQQVAMTRQRGHGWVSLNIGESPALVEQYQAALMALGEVPAELDELPVNPFSLWHQAASAVMAGTQGMLFRSLRPLDIQGTADSAQVAAVRLIQSDLDLWGPWIMAGHTLQPPQANRADYLVRGWGVGQSQLIIAMCMEEGADRCWPRTWDQPLELRSPEGPARQVLRLTQGELARVPTEVMPEGIRYVVQRPEPIEVLLIAESPRVLEFVRRRLATAATQRTSDFLEIAEYNLRIAERVVAARFTTQAMDVAAEERLRIENMRLAALQRQVELAWQALRANRANLALPAAMEASQGIQQMLREAIRDASAELAVPQSSPLVLSPALLPLHWRIAEACRRSTWEQLPLPGGQLSNIDELLQTGWSQERRIEEQVDLRVEILPASSERAGGLRMAAYQKPKVNGAEPLAGGYQGASLRVRSAAVPVRAGQLIRVTAVAQILTPGITPDSGLLVYDNHAGPSLGQLVRGAAGAQVPVELYRLATADGEFRILAECRGECDIVLSGLMAEAIMPATNRRSFLDAPLGAVPLPVEAQVYEMK